MDDVSICIPRIFLTISRAKIRQVFENLKLGDIDYIDIHLGSSFQRVFIYFKTWCSTLHGQGIKKRLLEGEEIKVIYDDPWFWKCRLNRSHNPHKSYNTVFVSKYNTRNQLIALKTLLNEERTRHKQQMKEKEEEILRLKTMSCMGDDALLRRKRLQQKAKQIYFMDSSGILFT